MPPYRHASVRSVVVFALVMATGAVTALIGCDDDAASCANGDCISFDAGSFDAIAVDARRIDDAANPDGPGPDGAIDELPDGGLDGSDSGHDAGIVDGPHAFAEDLEYPWRLAIGGGFLYATTGAGVVRIPTAGGEPTTITQDGSIDLVAADATNLYFTTNTGKVYKRAHGGASNVAISNAGVAVQAWGLMAVGGDVYWTEFLNGGRAMRVAIDGSTMAGVALSPALSLPKGLVVSGGQTYVAESAGTTGSGRIVRLSTDGGAPIPLSSNRTGASDPVTDGTRIYWFDNGGTSGPIYSLPLAGGSLATHANTAVHASLAIDGATFYYANSAGAIVKFVDGSPATLYTSEKTGPIEDLAVAGDALYWTDLNGRRIMTAKK